MVLDRNPRFGVDQSFTEKAKGSLEMLWGATKGDPSAIPLSYLENLRHEFSDGKVSMLELIDRVDLGPEATYDDYCEVVDALMSVSPGAWPAPETVLSVNKDALLYEIKPEWSFAEEEDFLGQESQVEGENADPMSEKMELFLKKVISSVYLDGVSEVTDQEGNPPSQTNNYLLSDDGKTFSGIFYDSGAQQAEAKQFPFAIKEGSKGQWVIEY